VRIGDRVTRINRDEFVELVTSFKRSAWRWECQGTYYEPDEAQPFRLWQEGRPHTSFMDDWFEMTSRWRAEGKTFQRVRMVTEPPTEYLLWMFEVTDLAIEAGDDIRWLGEADARRLGAPTYDFYLLDDDVLVILEFGEGGVAGAEVLDGKQAVDGARRWRQIAWASATPHTEYMATRRS
jgi:hypothetical protein